VRVTLAFALLGPASIQAVLQATHGSYHVHDALLSPAESAEKTPNFRAIVLCGREISIMAEANVRFAEVLNLPAGAASGHSAICGKHGYVFTIIVHNERASCLACQRSNISK
jgi:hypothetical protein